MMDLKYADILSRNRELRERIGGDPYRVAVLSNVTVDQVGEIFEYALRIQGVNAAVELGNYDNILQDSARLAGRDLYLVFWELANLIEGFQYRAEVMEAAALDELVAATKKSIDVLFSSLESAPLVVMNRFSALPFSHRDLRATPYDAAEKALNEHLQANAPANFVLVDLDKIYARLSVAQSVDFRGFYSAKAPYLPGFFKAYASFVSPAALSVLGKSKKALILDCDNTLWKGIVGEDGADKIEVPEAFKEVQNLALSLSKRGVVLGLCSKNEPEDVEAAFNHPDMALKKDDIAIRRINWTEKPRNVEEIARDLNIGADSLVVVDDSDFEVELLRGGIPDATVIQVPKNASEYPGLIREKMSLFYSAARSDEDSRRTLMYKQEESRKERRKSFQNVDEFLRSLKLEVDVHANSPSLIGRMAQLTQKTNQFNLTTRRYTEAEISAFVAAGDWDVLALDVRDAHGAYGVCGLCLLKIDRAAATAEIDSFLLSCRVLGRGIERAFFDFVAHRARESGIKSLGAVFRRTAKNGQAESFFDDLGFQVTGSEGPDKRYLLNLAEYRRSGVDYVAVRAAVSADTAST